MRVLIVEDDGLLGDAVRSALETAGFATRLVGSAESARAALKVDSFDLVILDIGLPGENGLQLLQRLRRQRVLPPVLMLTARDGPLDRLTALNLGAEDYLTKPFRVSELVARCRASIRRAAAAERGAVSLGRLTVDLSRKRASLEGRALDLTEREWAILEYLALDIGRLVSTETLLSALEDDRGAESPAVLEEDVVSLRVKLGASARIHSVRGMGYRLDDTSD